MRLILSLSIVAALLAGPAAASADAAKKKPKRPSAAFVKERISELFDATYRESWMDADDLQIAFSKYKALKPKKRKVHGGYYDKPRRVFPYRLNVLIRQDRGQHGIDETKRGWWHTDYPGGHEVFFFYRNPSDSGGWTMFTGSP